MGKLLLLFILVPALELWLLIEIGSRVGALPTLSLIVLTGALGAYLARRQGLGALHRIRSDTAQGRIPASSLADGLFILVAAALLLTPGILTDGLGFLLLTPPVRNRLKREIWRRLEQAGEEGRIHFSFESVFTGRTRSEPINVTPRDAREERVVRDRLTEGAEKESDH